MLSCGVFARADNQLSKLYFLSSMMNCDRINPGSFLTRQLYNTATSTIGRIPIGGLINSIASLGVLSQTPMIEFHSPSSLIKPLLD